MFNKNIMFSLLSEATSYKCKVRRRDKGDVNEDQEDSILARTNRRELTTVDLPAINLSKFTEMNAFKVIISPLNGAKSK